ncbi:MAG TPA: BamA/TamA family outer membrane protein [Gemmatimonadales bacterium]|nr:BamA/TamA family outer membrane protein [Gemmatimonadales bacterium]
MQLMVFPRRIAWLLPTILLSSVSPASAQYFGRNKVQYQSFDFRVLKTAHFDVYYYPTEQNAAAQAARMAERWRTRLGTVFQHELSGRQPLILYATPAQFQQTNAIGGDLGEGTGGVTEALRRRIVLPIGGTLGDLNHVIGHELTHAFQYDITGGGRSTSLGALPAATELPLWFIEGMAEYMSLGPIHAPTAMWLRGSLQDTTKDTLPSFSQLDDPRYFPYRYGHALLAYIAGHWGDQAIGQLLRRAGRRRGVDVAIREVLSVSPAELVKRWHQEVHAAYDPLQLQTTPPERLGPRIVAAEKDQGRYNVAPSLSPDGSEMMFLSDRDLFSIDLFLADARTGKIKKQITKTAVDPHLQSLEFIESAGSWSPDGRRFVFAAIGNGQPELVLYDVKAGKREREIRFPKLGQILNPSWSPDGSSIAFSGIASGLSDLYVYDLPSGKLRQLTQDEFADLQPAWSPDGRTIAFATDRFSTDLGTLRIGRYAVGLIDASTGNIRRLMASSGNRQLNPQWAPDGKSVYFLSDPRGITNIYRVNLADGQVLQVSNLFTGVSGITETSPAISVAQRSGKLVYSVFRANGYDLYGVDNPAAVATEPAVAYAAYGSAPPTSATLPPVDRTDLTLRRMLEDPVRGLPSETVFPVQPYKPGLSLTYIGQPSLVAGSSSYGTFIGGGASLYFSDLLGNHNLVTGLQVQGSLKDVNALVGYQNLTHRLNWALVAQQTPYLTGGFAEGTADINGEPALVDQQLLERQTNRDFFGQVAYPFNQVQRVEFAAGYTNISFDRELRTQAFSLLNGDQIVDDKVDLPAGRSLNMGVASAALVYDNSFFGATSPIFGQRYRLEVSPTIGSLNYVGGLVDFRKYIMPVRPFTIAARLMHYGRYGKDGEDPRLQPLFLGYPGLVRGYSFGSFDASECKPTPADPNACPVFDQLLGSRMVVGNAELRFPLLGVLGIGSGYYGAFPVDFTIFGDGGLAWDSQNQPSIFGSGSRDPVFSAGAGLRINLLGYAIAEIDLVRPFERPDKGWVWQFELQPGF